MAFGLSLTNHERKHANNLGYLNKRDRERAMLRLERSMRRTKKLSIDDKVAHKFISSSILYNARIASK